MAQLGRAWSLSQRWLSRRRCTWFVRPEGKRRHPTRVNSTAMHVSLSFSQRDRGERGSAVVEFAMVAPLAIVMALAVAQFALFLYERNVVMGSLSEGARVAASTGRTISDGQLASAKLLRESLGARVGTAVVVRGSVEDGLAVLRTDATLPSFVPGLPGLRIRMTASMHREDHLGVRVEPGPPPSLAPARVTDTAGASAPRGVTDRGGGSETTASDGRREAALETGHGVAPEAEGLRR